MRGASHLEVGSSAPDFTAPATGGGAITLSDFLHRHRVVLSFYPQDFSWGCSRQLCSYRDEHAEFSRRNAVVLGISQNTPDSQASFAARNGFPFPLLSDNKGIVARRYGVARLGGFLPFPRRVTFVIDEEGVIRGMIRHELGVGRHLTEALSILDQMKAEGKANKKG